MTNELHGKLERIENEKTLSANYDDPKVALNRLRYKAGTR